MLLQVGLDGTGQKILCTLPLPSPICQREAQLLCLRPSNPPRSTRPTLNHENDYENYHENHHENHHENYHENRRENHHENYHENHHDYRVDESVIMTRRPGIVVRTKTAVETRTKMREVNA